MRTSDAKAPRRGRPLNHRFPNRDQLVAAVLARSLRVFEDGTGIQWAEVEPEIRRAVDENDQQLPKEPMCEELLSAMEAAVKAADGRESPFAVWVRKEIQPLLERDRFQLEVWAPRLRQRLPSVYTSVVEALDRFNFLGRLDREAAHAELAAVALLLGANLGISLARARARRPAGVSVEEVMGAATEVIRKARLEHGRPTLIRRWKREREWLFDPLAELRRITLAASPTSSPSRRSKL